MKKHIALAVLVVVVLGVVTVIALRGKAPSSKLEPDLGRPPTRVDTKGTSGWKTPTTNDAKADPPATEPGPEAIPGNGEPATPTDPDGEAPKSPLTPGPDTTVNGWLKETKALRDSLRKQLIRNFKTRLASAEGLHKSDVSVRNTEVLLRTLADAVPDLSSESAEPIFDTILEGGRLTRVIVDDVGRRRSAAFERIVSGDESAATYNDEEVRRVTAHDKLWKVRIRDSIKSAIGADAWSRYLVINKFYYLHPSKRQHVLIAPAGSTRPTDTGEEEGKE